MRLADYFKSLWELGDAHSRFGDITLQCTGDQNGSALLHLEICTGECWWLESAVLLKISMTVVLLKAVGTSPGAIDRCQWPWGQRLLPTPTSSRIERPFIGHGSRCEKEDRI